MKKFFLFLICAFAMMSSKAETTFTVGSLNYSFLSNGEVQCDGFSTTALAQNAVSVHIPGRVAYNGTEYKVYSVGPIAFKYCSSLKNVYVDWGIVEIGQQAFYGCSALTNVQLPSTVTSILENAFADCTSMAVFAIAAATPPTTASTSFARMKKCAVHVSTEQALYKFNNSSVWTGIDSDATVARTPSLAYDLLSSGRYYVIHSDRNVSSNSAKATLIGVDSSVTFIAITSVTDDISVTFGDCSQGYTANVTKIADKACLNNTRITSVGRHDLGPITGFEEVGTSAFEGCTSLTFACIPCGSINSNAFMDCTALSEVQLYSTANMDNGVRWIGSNAFSGCTNLHELLVTSTHLALFVGEFGTTASDFKCYVPLKTYYYNCSNKSDEYLQKIYPFVKPENEWTAISCFRPLQLPSNAEFYIVESVTKSGNNFVANKKRVTGNVAANTGMLMKATPGAIYRLNYASYGTGYPNNKLHGVQGNYYEPETYTSDLYVFSNHYRYFWHWTSGSLWSGEAYLSYTDSANPSTIYFDGTYVPYNLKIAGNQVTSENCNDLTVLGDVSGEQVSFNPSTRVLTLKNATIGGTNSYSINTADEGITINVIGTNTINGIYLVGNSYDHSSITGGGTLNMLRPLLSSQDLTIKGNTKVSITVPSNSTAYDYAIDHTSQNNRNYALLTLEGSDTELRLNSTKHLLRSTLNLNDGLYIAKPTGASFKTFDWSTTGGVLIDAYGSELYNTEALIACAEARGFKYRGLWYEDTGNNYVTLIEPQQGENYAGDVVIPDAFSRNGIRVVNKIDSNAFTGTLVTSVEVPAGVTDIGDKAFYGAKNLTTLVLNSDKLPNKYTYVGDNFVGNNASGFACYVTNSTLLRWMQDYTNISFAPWIKTYADNGYATFSCARNVTLPEGLSAYRVSGFDQAERMAKTTKITSNRIPNKTGVILKGEPDTRYLLPVTTSASNVGDNLLKPFLTAEHIPYEPFATNPDDTKAYFLPHLSVEPKEWREFKNDVNLFMAMNAGIAYLAVDKTLLDGDYTSPVQLDIWSAGVRGDLNGDGQVDVTDVSLAIDMVLGKSEPNLLLADLDNNGQVDVTDVSIIIDIVLGKA